MEYPPAKQDKKTMCISTLCPDYARKAGIANTTTAAKKDKSIQHIVPTWRCVGRQGVDGYNVEKGNLN